MTDNQGGEQLASVMARLVREAVTRERLEAARKEAVRQVREEDDRFESAFGLAPIGMTLIDMDGRWLQVNDAFCRLTGHQKSELVATTLRSMIHPDDADLDLPLLQRLLAGEILNYQVEKRCRHAWGHYFWVLLTASLVRNRDGDALYLINQFQDISDRKELARHVEFLVDHDFLTGLYNRRLFEQHLEQEAGRTARYGTAGAVLLIDLDNFKDVNDTFGHLAGDDLLKGVAGLLRHRMRQTDTVARVGGDEFAVLLPQTDAAQAEVVAAGIVGALGKQTAVMSSQSIRITASVGVAMFERADRSEVMACADLAMYEAKRAGRNRYVVYRTVPTGSGSLTARQSEAGRIQRALEDDSFVLHCQPILDLRTGEITQHELLLRLPGDDRGELLPPSSFLYVAERTGMIAAIDGWVFRRAVGLIAANARFGKRLVLNVNLSARSLGDPSFLRLIEDAFLEGGADPNCLVFEITETAAIANLEQARCFAERLRRLGCQLALDDFGAGFASFYYLKNIPLDYIKIDGEFIRHLDTRRLDRLLVKAIVDIAKGMGKKTIAEYVGSADVATFLREQGVDFAQGYHIGAPRPVTEVTPSVD